MACFGGAGPRPRMMSKVCHLRRTGEVRKQRAAFSHLSHWRRESSWTVALLLASTTSPKCGGAVQGSNSGYGMALCGYRGRGLAERST